MSDCLWCHDPNAEEFSPTLCRMHEAEWLGTSVADLDRGEREQESEWLDTLS